MKVEMTLPVTNSPYSLRGRKATPDPSEHRSCVKVEVVVLGSKSLTVLTVSVDVEAALEEEEPAFRAQELCKSRGGGPPALPVTNSPYSLCGRKAASNPSELKYCEKVEVAPLPSRP